LKKRARELRQAQTDGETLLWDLLRDRQLGGVKFRRQHQFGDYICDFFSEEARLVVECDGAAHVDFHPEMIKTVGDGANIRNFSQAGLNELEIPLATLARIWDEEKMEG